jgi:hypothetical protein
MEYYHKNTTPTQGGLFDAPPKFLNRAPLAARNDPETSKLAGDELTRSGTRSNQKLDIFEWMKRNCNIALTSREIALPNPEFSSVLLSANCISSHRCSCSITGPAQPSLI